MDISALKNMLESAKTEDFEEQYQYFIETIGKRAFIGLCEAFGGAMICVPTSKEITKLIVYKAVLSDLERYSVREVSKKYGISIGTIYNIKKQHPVNKNKTNKIQCNSSIAEFIREADISDFPKRYHQTISVIGKENFLKLSYGFSGERIYIPMLNTISQKYINKKIEENEEGLSIKELAHKYGCSTSKVQKTIKRGYVQFKK